MAGFPRLLPPLRLAPRIGLAILLTIGAAFLLNQALRFLIPPPPFLIVERDWLVDAVVAGAQATATGRPPNPRTAEYLDFTIVDSGPPATPSGSKLEDGLRRSIAARLRVAPERVRIATQIYDQNYAERTVRTTVAIVPDVPALLVAETLASNDSTVLGDLAIAVRRDDGRWLMVTQRNLNAPSRHYARIAAGAAGYLLILILFSVWMARSIVFPLTRLAAAAERLGRFREPTPVEEMRLPEYAAIADTFNTMQRRLKHYVDERTGMLAAISHDLRTPLTRLRLMAEYVESAEQREQLLANVEEMETMVGDALAFMGEEARREPFEIVDLAALLISLTDEYGDLGHRVAYAGPDHAELSCRPVALKRAFSNLVANGCKYGGAVEVRLIVTADLYTVDIYDEGSGIAPGDEARAFRPFERLETSRNRATGGSGLGLSISRDIVSGHGGTIGFVRPDRGFIVRVALPRPPASGGGQR